MNRLFKDLTSIANEFFLNPLEESKFYRGDRFEVITRSSSFHAQISQPEDNHKASADELLAKIQNLQSRIADSQRITTVSSVFKLVCIFVFIIIIFSLLMIVLVAFFGADPLTEGQKQLNQICSSICTTSVGGLTGLLGGKFIK